MRDNQLGKGLSCFFIRSDFKYYRVDYSAILYVEARRVYCRIVTTDKTWMVLMPIHQLGAILPASGFCRVHRSFIVSICCIEWFDKKLIRIGGQDIPIGTVYQAGLRRKILLLPAETEKAASQEEKSPLCLDAL